MIKLYDYSSIEELEKKQKNKLITVLIIDAVLLCAIVGLFFLVNRNNVVWLSIIIGLIMLILLSMTYFYFFTDYLINRHDIKFIKHLKQYESKINHIFGFEIKDEMINKFNKSFYVVHYETKNKSKEGYLDIDKVELLKGLKINLIEVKDRIITGLEGEKNEQ
jgi:Na+/H+-translocating membrane pyrophosphatase